MWKLFTSLGSSLSKTMGEMGEEARQERLMREQFERQASLQFKDRLMGMLMESIKLPVFGLLPKEAQSQFTGLLQQLVSAPTLTPELQESLVSNIGLLHDLNSRLQVFDQTLGSGRDDAYALALSLVPEGKDPLSQAFARYLMDRVGATDADVQDAKDYARIMRRLSRDAKQTDYINRLVGQFKELGITDPEQIQLALKTRQPILGLSDAEVESFARSLARNIGLGLEQQELTNRNLQLQAAAREITNKYLGAKEEAELSQAFLQNLQLLAPVAAIMGLTTPDKADAVAQLAQQAGLKLDNLAPELRQKLFQGVTETASRIVRKEEATTKQAEAEAEGALLDAELKRLSRKYAENEYQLQQMDRTLGILKDKLQVMDPETAKTFLAEELPWLKPEQVEDLAGSVVGLNQRLYRAQQLELTSKELEILNAQEDRFFRAVANNPKADPAKLFDVYFGNQVLKDLGPDSKLGRLAQDPAFREGYVQAARGVQELAGLQREGVKVDLRAKVMEMYSKVPYPADPNVQNKLLSDLSADLKRAGFDEAAVQGARASLLSLWQANAQAVALDKQYKLALIRNIDSEIVQRDRQAAIERANAIFSAASVMSSLGGRLLSTISSVLGRVAGATSGEAKDAVSAQKAVGDLLAKKWDNFRAAVAAYYRSTQGERGTCAAAWEGSTGLIPSFDTCPVPKDFQKEYDQLVKDTKDFIGGSASALDKAGKSVNPQAIIAQLQQAGQGQAGGIAPEELLAILSDTGVEAKVTKLIELGLKRLGIDVDLDAATRTGVDLNAIIQYQLRNAQGTSNGGGQQGTGGGTSAPVQSGTAPTQGGTAPSQGNAAPGTSGMNPLPAGPDRGGVLFKISRLSDKATYPPPTPSSGSGVSQARWLLESGEVFSARNAFAQDINALPLKDIKSTGGLYPPIYKRFAQSWNDWAPAIALALVPLEGGINDKEGDIRGPLQLSKYYRAQEDRLGCGPQMGPARWTVCQAVAVGMQVNNSEIGVGIKYGVLMAPLHGVYHMTPRGYSLGYGGYHGVPQLPKEGLQLRPEMLPKPLKPTNDKAFREVIQNNPAVVRFAAQARGVQPDEVAPGDIAATYAYYTLKTILPSLGAKLGFNPENLPEGALMALSYAAAVLPRKLPTPNVDWTRNWRMAYNDSELDRALDWGASVLVGTSARDQGSYRPLMREILRYLTYGGLRTIAEGVRR